MRAFAAALCFVLALALGLAAPRAQAQGWVDQPFDPAPMSREDIATVQIALAYTGDFFGIADGSWKEDSQKALEQYVSRVVGNVRPTYGHLKDLVIFLEDERVANNWQIYYVQRANVTYLHPYGLLKRVDNPQAEEYLSDDGNFSLKIWDHSQADMQGMHDWFQSQAVKDSKPYSYKGDNLWVTDAKLDDKMNVFVRSDLYNGQWTTISMVVTEDHYFRMNVVAVSSTQGGSPAALMWTEGGVLDQVINGVTSAAAPSGSSEPDFRDQVRRPVAAGVEDAPPPVEMPPPSDPGPVTSEVAGIASPPLGTTPPAGGDAPAGGLGTPAPGGTSPGGTESGGAGVIGVASPGSEPARETEGAAPLPPLGTGVGAAPAPGEAKPKLTGSIKGSGTGFYIAPTTLVTAAHVIEGCGAVGLIDGTPLEVINTDPSLDVAVLTGATDVGAWLKLSALEVPKLGETVTALGYPYYTSLDQGLTVTSGNVSALRGIDGSSNRVMITAPVQPGNSGGPLLNKKGAVIGVVVSRVDDMAILEETGSLPQNMNFAVPSGPLLTFLAQSRVTRPQGEGSGGDMSGGLPDAVATAVVPLYCYQ